MRPDLPDQVEIVTADALRKLNGATKPNIIARTLDHIYFAKGQPGLVLFDFDQKGMPADVRQRIDEAGGFEAALLSVLPELANAARLIRSSTSAGLRNAETGEPFPSIGGAHVYTVAEDAADIPRFLNAAHQRAWLAGFGWGMIGKAGQFLERSIIDATVGSPERLVVEGAPVLVPPVMQDTAARKPQVSPGPALDTRAACHNLTVKELADYERRVASERDRLAPAAAAARAAFIEAHAREITERAGISKPEATRVVEQQIAGRLLPSVMLDFDDEDLGRCTVAEVLADPERFIGAKLADPIEGIDYGRGKAMVLRDDRNGGLRIHSFAHGLGLNYQLQLDTAAIEAAILAADKSKAAEVLMSMALGVEITPST